MNPVLNGLLRLTGIAPLVGPMPLSNRKFNQLFKATPAFVDYFPVVDYDAEHAVFIFDDDINVGIGWELTAKDLDAKPPETLELFNQFIGRALADLPEEEEYPYVVQIFLQNAEVDNLGDMMLNAMSPQLKKDQLSLKVVELMREHSQMLTHEKGAFADSRLSNDDQGWRISTQKIYVVIYRKAPESFWKKTRKTPIQKIIDDTRSFLSALSSQHIKAQPLDDFGLINWLAPLFSADSFERESYTREIHDNTTPLASYDIGQQCFQNPPKYHDSKDDYEQGIYQFGSKYHRYLTTDGLQQIPENGCLTIAQRGSSQDEVNASPWEQFPPGTMFTWTIIPETKSIIDDKIDKVAATAQKSNSDASDFTKEQADEARRQCMRYGQRIYYVQFGAFLSADSLEDLLEKTTQSIDSIKNMKALRFIRPEHDLISQDSFIRSLPFIYDFEHDRNNSLRARMTYLSQLAATLPLYGVGKGSSNPCYIMYKRSGEPFMFNPYLSSDRERVAHQMVFGPTGAGKSATMVYLMLMSMAVNGPRQFVLDKGNSFGLLANFYEQMGKQVRRYTFNAASNDNFPPFFETHKALMELEEIKGTLEISEDDEKNQHYDEDDDSEKRSYIAEMLNMIKIMATGGRSEQVRQMTQSDINFMQKSLIRGLNIAKEKGAKHAIVSDIHQAMMEHIDEEKIPKFVERFREIADGIELWTDGIRGKLFNQIGEGFDENADLTIIETGALTEEGSEDMFAVAGLAALTNISALGEKLQFENRHIEVTLDEGHYWVKLGLLINGLIQGTKVWRKLGIWLTLGTQDFSDFPDDAKKILSQAENWLLLSMGEDEASQVSRFKDLTDEEHYLIRQANIEKPNFTEATLLTKTFGCGLNRFIPPSLVLALAQTDKDEKAVRRMIMKEHNCSELDATFIVAKQIQENRLKWQNQT